MAKKPIDARTTLYIVADSVDHGLQRLFYLLFSIESGELDPDKIGVTEIPEAPAKKPEPAPDYDLEGLLPKRPRNASPSALIARPPRYSGQYPTKERTGSTPGMKPAMCGQCGERLGHARKIIDKVNINYRLCPKCGASNLAEKLREIETGKR